ncbi:cytochrome d ubiquinol oxidase subunit II [Brockia lithotrophica]|uniref:Cytochrome bd-I ubiquinol oxidase subunit 2 apoprotein n=1 Tax=Brockia lithotrophica TaxID=933949 RepID=A0A660KYS3_9BACL|nr:cytochrome d ubiquinol oxidase subunit II [Brockia lithotrophica]RKQ85497.1 cytochrome bd-I ubiquinol oxidase subunit 2 apoprotein [Brockia lithotrophica]
MDLETLAALILWTFLFGYVLFGAVDFGTGFFSAWSAVRDRNPRLHDAAQRLMAPLWEVTNVFLVFFVVGIVGFFPLTAYYYGAALLVPLGAGLVLLGLRGAYYAFHTYSPEKRPVFTYVYGLTGLAIPAALAAVLTVSEGGFIATDGFPTLDLAAFLGSAYTWAMFAVGLLGTVVLAAAFLSWYLERSEERDLAEKMRHTAIAVFPYAFLADLFALALMVRESPMRPLLVERGAAGYVVSAVLAVAAYALLRTRRPAWAFLAAAGQYAAAFYAYGVVHYPYLLYPYLTVYDGFTPLPMAHALLVGFVLGLFVLVPALVLLLRTFLFPPSPGISRRGEVS